MDMNQVLAGAFYSQRREGTEHEPFTATGKNEKLIARQAMVEEMRCIELDMFLAYPERDDAIALAQYKWKKATTEVEKQFYNNVVECLTFRRQIKDVFKR